MPISIHYPLAKPQLMENWKHSGSDKDTLMYKGHKNKLAKVQFIHTGF